jgi:hypothetical protein
MLHASIIVLGGFSVCLSLSGLNRWLISISPVYPIVMLRDTVSFCVRVVNWTREANQSIG